MAKTIKNAGSKINTNDEDELTLQARLGIIMPISATEGCSESHWSDVREIIEQCAEDAGFEAQMVSEADDVGIIHKRIIQNLYDNPIVVCDISEKNPNVMFELGMRLAFDKPTVLIKDDLTDYVFDTSSIEHLTYPRDLHFQSIISFKQKLADKIRYTYNASQKDKEFSPFLKAFGAFKVAKIEKTEVGEIGLIMDELRMLRSEVRRSNLRDRRMGVGTYVGARYGRPERGDIDLCLKNASLKAEKKLAEFIKNELDAAITVRRVMDHHHFSIKTGEMNEEDKEILLEKLNQYLVSDEVEGVIIKRR